MRRAWSFLGLALAVSVVVGARAYVRAEPRQSDLDDFMAQVLVRRDENWKKLQQYVLDERERVEVRGPGAIPIWGEARTYTWYIRDGFFVRSPVTANGVTVSDDDRKRYENQFLQRARRREKDASGAPASAASGAGAPAQAPADLNGLLTQSRQPQFIDTAYFLRFKFEPGKYALVGRETIDGTPVLRIEYYPARLFSHEQDAEAKRKATAQSNRHEDMEAAHERLMNKTSLVTLWVEPSAHQIVKYSFDNVNMDFLPAAWLFRITDLKATMTMGEAFGGVWLPRGVDMDFGMMLAVGAFDLRYRVLYDDYREATTGGRILSMPAR